MFLKRLLPVSCMLFLLVECQSHWSLPAQDGVTKDFTEREIANREKLKRGLACVSGELLFKENGTGKLFVSMYLRNGYSIDHPGKPPGILHALKIHTEKLKISDLQLVSKAVAIELQGKTVSRFTGLVEFEADVKINGRLEEDGFVAGTLQDLMIFSETAGIAFSKQFAIHCRKIH